LISRESKREDAKRHIVEKEKERGKRVQPAMSVSKNEGQRRMLHHGG